MELIHRKDGTRYNGLGAELPMSGYNDDRGNGWWVDMRPTHAVFTTGDQITFRPVLRTPDGNGLRLMLELVGPLHFRAHYKFTCIPSAVGGDAWLIGDQTITLPSPGKYEIIITGEVAWPVESYRVKYSIDVAEKR